MTCPIHRVVLVGVVLGVIRFLVFREGVSGPVRARQMGDEVVPVGWIGHDRQRQPGKWICGVVHELQGQQQLDIAGSELRLASLYRTGQASVAVVLVSGELSRFASEESAAGDSELSGESEFSFDSTSNAFFASSTACAGPHWFR